VPATDGLFVVTKTGSDGLRDAIEQILGLVTGPVIEIASWASSGYKPTPTIIEATLALYRGHSVADITRKEAGTTNLSSTSGTVGKIFANARHRSEKAACFVTGVPGAGKTLVGLDAATRHMSPRDDLYSIFLSGNGPLVAVLQRHGDSGDLTTSAIASHPETLLHRERFTRFPVTARPPSRRLCRATARSGSSRTSP